MQKEKSRKCQLVHDWRLSPSVEFVMMGGLLFLYFELDELVSLLSRGSAAHLARVHRGRPVTANKSQICYSRSTLADWGRGSGRQERELKFLSLCLSVVQPSLISPYHWVFGLICLQQPQLHRKRWLQPKRGCISHQTGFRILGWWSSMRKMMEMMMIINCTVWW